MSITQIIPRWQGRGATTDENGVRTLTREWAVTTSADLTGEPDVIDAVIALDPSAALYASHPNWPWALCRKLTAKPYGSALVWLVTAEYSSGRFAASGDGSGSGGGGGGGGSPANPTSPDVSVSNQAQADQRPPTISASRKEVTEILEKDVVTGDRVLNVLGDPFDPLPEVFRSHQVLTFRFCRSPANLDWGLRAAFMDTLNETDVTVIGCTYPAGELRCVDYSFDTVWDTGDAGLSLFFQFTCVIEWKRGGWQPEILNTGRRRLLSGSLGDPIAHPPKLAAIVDDNGQPVSDPVPLTSGGQPTSDPNFFHYMHPKAYPVLEWNGTADSIFGPSGIMH